TAVLSLSIARSASSTPVIYGASLVFSAIAFVIALAYLATSLPAAEASALVLPLGLPWLGIHFRIDALAAFFPVIVQLGGALSHLYGLGQGR
ncbi:hydrogenase 4 subunit B, partial [Rhizobium ruizarguesonis]